jgi:hypothetical protein
MYSYNAICEDGNVLLSPTMKTIKALRSRYFRNREMFEDQAPVTEIVVFKGGVSSRRNRIHGYYTSMSLSWIVASLLIFTIFYMV